jgi:valyl-tRNA synthetase
VTRNRKPDFDAARTEKYFDHTRLESSIYEWWERSDYFSPRPPPVGSKTEKPFVVPMPPPNVTGYLHMGHALFASIQDTVVRFHRMRGRETLWLPGTDHAGIATQLVVELELAKANLSRKGMGREAFIEKVWEWKREKGGRITSQLRRLGASADWKKEKFTLDADMCIAVTEAFVRLHANGLVYRGDYMVNWAPSLQTAVSDLEVEYSEEKGYMYYFKYFLVPEEGDCGPTSTATSTATAAATATGGADAGAYIPIATTRLETVFGDTALCVHPEDSRYSHLIGRRARVPLSGREIPSE